MNCLGENGFTTTFFLSAIELCCDFGTQLEIVQILVFELSIWNWQQSIMRFIKLNATFQLHFQCQFVYFWDISSFYSFNRNKDIANLLNKIVLGKTVCVVIIITDHFEWAVFVHSCSFINIPNLSIAIFNCM